MPRQPGGEPGELSDAPRESGMWAVRRDPPQPAGGATRRLHVVVLETGRGSVNWIARHADREQVLIAQANELDAARAALRDDPDALLVHLRIGESLRLAGLVRELRPLDVPLVALADDAALAGCAIELGAEAVVVPQGGEPLAEAVERVLGVCRALCRRSDPRVRPQVRPLLAAYRALVERTEQTRLDAAMVAHDLRTPLNVLAAVEEELTDRRLLDDMLGGIVRRTLGQLRSLVDRLEALGTSPPLRLERLCIATEARQIAAQLTRSSDGPSVTVRGDSSAECDVDRVLLERVLSNLVSNARRHATSQIDLHVRARRGAVRVAVVDDGPGLPDSVRDALFERYVRGSGGGRVGLGLAIVKAAVDRLGGRVSAHDRRDLDPSAPHGACFIVRLPRR